MSWWDRFKEGFWRGLGRTAPAFRRRVCAHANVGIVAATGAHQVGPANVEVGVVARCGDCGASWAGDVRAGAPSPPCEATEIRHRAHRYSGGDTRPS